MAHPELIDEIANELETWPGVHIERRSATVAVARFDKAELGVLDRERGLLELRFGELESGELVESGEAEPAEPVLEGESVSHDVRGPSDVTAALELLDRRYRELRGEGPVPSSSDPV